MGMLDGRFNVQNDVLRIVQPLVAGSNVITHNLGFVPTEVEIRDNITGDEISLRVTAETATTVTLFVPVAPLNPVRITLDV